MLRVAISMLVHDFTCCQIAWNLGWTWETPTAPGARSVRPCPQESISRAWKWVPTHRNFYHGKFPCQNRCLFRKGQWNDTNCTLQILEILQMRHRNKNVGSWTTTAHIQARRKLNITRAQKPLSCMQLTLHKKPTISFVIFIFYTNSNTQHMKITPKIIGAKLPTQKCYLGWFFISLFLASLHHHDLIAISNMGHNLEYWQRYD